MQGRPGGLYTPPPEMQGKVDSRQKTEASAPEMQLVNSISLACAIEADSAQRPKGERPNCRSDLLSDHVGHLPQTTYCYYYSVWSESALRTGLTD